MAISYMDFTSPNVAYSFDMHTNTIIKKNNENLISAAGIQQLNTMGNTYLLDIHFTKNNVVEPHSHPNASEVVYCISGESIISVINPFTKDLVNSTIAPGQIATIPQGWVHYATAVSEQCHLLAIHDTPILQTVWGSDTLRLLPPHLLAHTYCLNEEQVTNTLKPIDETVIIGPSNDCESNTSNKITYYENRTYRK